MAYKMNETIEQKNRSLLSLQKEYLQLTIKKIDEMIDFATDLDNITDEELLQKYVEQINHFENDIDQTYKIACDIEKHIKR